MTMFRNAVHEIVNTGLRSLSHPVQGYIPAGMVDKETNTCTVRVPNQHGGVHPNADGNYIELKAVPLPFFYRGIIGGIADLVQRGDRGVIVGFKGANHANPYIVSPLPSALNPDKKDQTVDDRKSVAKYRTTNIGGSHTLTTPDTMKVPTPSVQRFSDISTPGPPAAFGSASAQKLGQFNGLQSQMKSQVSSLSSFSPTPVVSPKR